MGGPEVVSKVEPWIDVAFLDAAEEEGVDLSSVNPDCLRIANDGDSRFTFTEFESAYMGMCIADVATGIAGLHDLAVSINRFKKELELRTDDYFNYFTVGRTSSEVCEDFTASVNSGMVRAVFPEGVFACSGIHFDKAYTTLVERGFMGDDIVFMTGADEFVYGRVFETKDGKLVSVEGYGWSDLKTIMEGLPPKDRATFLETIFENRRRFKNRGSAPDTVSTEDVVAKIYSSKVWNYLEESDMDAFVDMITLEDPISAAEPGNFKYLPVKYKNKFARAIAYSDVPGVNKHSFATSNYREIGYNHGGSGAYNKQFRTDIFAQIFVRLLREDGPLELGKGQHKLYPQRLFGASSKEALPFAKAVVGKLSAGSSDKVIDFRRAVFALEVLGSSRRVTEKEYDGFEELMEEKFPEFDVDLRDYPEPF